MMVGSFSPSTLKGIKEKVGMRGFNSKKPY
jgi:hypothetical protein